MRGVRESRTAAAPPPMRRRRAGSRRMTLSTALSETLVRALRLPGPHVPGWYPLVAERAHRVFHLGNGIRTADVLGSQMALDSDEYMQRRFYYHCYEAPAVRFF